MIGHEHVYSYVNQLEKSSTFYINKKLSLLIIKHPFLEIEFSFNMNTKQSLTTILFSDSNDVRLKIDHDNGTIRNIYMRMFFKLEDCMFLDNGVLHINITNQDIKFGDSLCDYEKLDLQGRKINLNPDAISNVFKTCAHDYFGLCEKNKELPNKAKALKNMLKLLICSNVKVCTYGLKFKHDSEHLKITVSNDFVCLKIDYIKTKKSNQFVCYDDLDVRFIHEIGEVIICKHNTENIVVRPFLIRYGKFECPYELISDEMIQLNNKLCSKLLGQTIFKTEDLVKFLQLNFKTNGNKKSKKKPEYFDEKKISCNDNSIEFFNKDSLIVISLVDLNRIESNKYNLLNDNNNYEIIVYSTELMIHRGDCSIIIDVLKNIIGSVTWESELIVKKHLYIDNDMVPQMLNLSAEELDVFILN
jgi:hypothetical protein